MRRTRWLFILVGIVALAALFLVVRGRTRGPQAPVAGAGRGSDAQSRPVPVVAATVARRDVPIYLEGLGNVLAFRTVSVKTQVDGRLDQVMFTEGQAVRRGDVLAQIDPRPFQIQLHQGEGALARDRAQLAGARLNLERYRSLVKEKLIPEQQVSDQLALVGQLEGAVRIDEAAIETARLNLDYARIRSPIDGITGIRVVDPGNVVHPGDANGIVVVTQIDPIAIIFTLPQDQLTPVFQELSRGALPVEVYSRDGSTQLAKGELALVDNQINQATSTMRLKAVVPNPQRLLWPNQFVNVRLHLTTRRGTLVMPVTALQRGPSGTFVYAVTAEGTAAARPVELAGTQGDIALVASGVADGERVVVDGQNQLRPGSRVAVREPAQQNRGGQPPNGAANATAPPPNAAGASGGRPTEPRVAGDGDTARGGAPASGGGGSAVQ